MTYVKLLGQGLRKHLATEEDLADKGATLCGCVVTRIASWKRVLHLEGDECERCAELAFNAASNTGASINNSAIRA